MPMRLSGLMSGMDTESIIQQLVSAKKTKVTKAVKAQKSLKYKQDAWKDLNKQIVNLYNKSLTQMRFQSSYMKKVTKVSNSSIVSVITGESAMNSVQSLEVDKLARSGYLTGGKLQLWDADNNKAKDGAVTSTTKLSELGFTGSASFTVKTVDGVGDITVDGDSTVGNFISALRTIGLNANFDENNGRIHITSKASGKENDFSIKATDGAGFAALEALKLSYGYDDSALKKQYQDIIDGWNDKTAAGTVSQRQEARLKGLVENWNTLKSNRTGLLKGLSDEAIAAVNERLSAVSSDLKLEGSGEELKLVKTNADSTTTDIPLSDITEEDWGKINDAIGAAASKLIADSGNGTLTEDEKNALLDLAESFEDWTKNQNALTAVETNFQHKSDTDHSLDFEADGKTPKLAQHVKDSIAAEVEKEAENAKDVLEKLTKFDNLTEEEKKKAIAALGQKTSGQDAEIMLNGVLYTSDKNTFDINGLTLTVSATTAPGESVTITTEDDTNGIYDMVKNFFKEYNAVINQMDKLYNAEAAKGYEPLTDEEKEAMSDSQIEEWENKIKDSILRKDSTLSFFASEMKRIMMEGVEMEDGKKMYLSNFGIGTLNYYVAKDNERYAYHIDGDPDDENTANNPDKLKSMIANDPDTVVSFFTKLSQKMSDKMFEMMRSEEGVSSAMTAYEDKKMQKEYDDYTAKIKELEKKLADYEDKWYAKFAAMETALAKMQNNASAVTSLLGG